MTAFVLKNNQILVVSVVDIVHEIGAAVIGHR